MTNVVALKEANSIDKLVAEIRGHLYDAKGAETKFNKHRLAAGQKLLALRKRIEAGEAGEVTWWEWFETADIGRSRRDAEKLMRMAGADDPDEAHETEKREARERMQNVRTANVRRMEEYDIVEDALNLVAKMSEEERERFDATYMETYHV